MKNFEKISEVYDGFIVANRFEYSDILKIIDKFVISYPRNITDLASGTGNMAFELHKRWPKALINCEEPSSTMIKELKRKFPFLKIKKNNLQNVKIANQDIVSITFNSINYISKKYFKKVFKNIYTGLNNEGIFYFDIISKNNSLTILGKRKSVSKEKTYLDWRQSSILTKDKIVHNFFHKNRLTEHHTQYLYDTNSYISLLEVTGFKIVYLNSLHNDKRILIVCKKHEQI